jgi:hypothetical protein
MWGVPFYSFLFVGLLFAILLTALIPAPEVRRLPPEPGAEVTKEEKQAAITLNIFFWILIVGLIILIIFGHLH